MTAPTPPALTAVTLYDGPQFNPENVIVGQAALYLRKYTKGKTALQLLPPANLPLWAAWNMYDTEWRPIGMTEEGVTNAFARSTEDINGEEQAIPVLVTTENAEWNVNTVLIEDTIKTMQLAFGGGKITVVEANTQTKQPGYEDLQVSEEMELLALGIEGVNEYGFARRMIVPKVVSVADVEISNRRSADKRKYETSFRSLCRTKDVLIRNYTTAQIPANA